MCLPYPPASSSPQSRSEAEIIGETKAAEEFPAHLSSSEESTGSWSQLANDEDNPDDTSSYLQLSERSLRYHIVSSHCTVWSAHQPHLASAVRGNSSRFTQNTVKDV